MERAQSIPLPDPKPAPVAREPDDDSPLTFDLAAPSRPACDDVEPDYDAPPIPAVTAPGGDNPPELLGLDAADYPNGPTWDGIRAPRRPLVLVSRTAGYVIEDAINDLGTLRVVVGHSATYKFGVTYSDDVDAEDVDASALEGVHWRYWTTDYTNHIVDLTKPTTYHRPIIDAIREHVAVIEV